jgi:hypothetical protein
LRLDLRQSQSLVMTPQLRPAIKFAPGGRWQGRIDASNYFYRIRYPDSYFLKPTPDPTVLDDAWRFVGHFEACLEELEAAAPQPAPAN